MLRPPPTSTLFPYTTLFRSQRADHLARVFPARDGAVPQGGRGRVVRASARGLRRTGTGVRALRQCHVRSEEHTSELLSRFDLVCRLLLEKKKKNKSTSYVKS